MENARELATRLVDPHFTASTKDFDEMGGVFAIAKEMRLRKIEKAEAMIKARDAAIRAEARQLPRAMVDEIWQEAEYADDIDKIIARHGYTVKEEV